MERCLSDISLEVHGGPSLADLTDRGPLAYLADGDLSLADPFADSPADPRFL